MSYRRSASYTRDQINELITLFPEAAHLKNRLKQDEDLESLFQDTMVHLANVMGDSSAVVQEFLRRRSQKRMKDEKRARQRAGVRFLEELVVQEQAEAEEARENNTDPLTSSSPMGKTPLDKVSKLFRGILASTVEEEDPFSHRSSRESNESRTPSSTSRSGQDPTMQREGVISEPAREEPAENTQACSSASSTTSTPSATPSETPSATSSTRTPSRETPLQEQKKEQEQEPAKLIEPEETRSPATVLPPSEPRAPFDLPVPQRQQQQQFSHEQSKNSTKRVSYGVVGTVAEQATCNIPIYGPPKSWGQNNDNYYILNGRPQSTSNRTKTLHSSFSMSPKYQRRQLRQQPLRQQRPIRLDAPPQHSINELQTPSLVSELSLNSFAQSHESIGQMDAPPPPPPPQQQQQQPRHDDQSMNPVSQTSTTCTNTAQSSVVQVDPPQHTKGDHQILTNRTQRNATTLTQFRDKFGHMMNGSRQHTKPGHNQTLIPVSNGSATMTAKSISQTAAPTQHAKTDHQSLGQRATTGKQSYDSFGQRVFPPRHTQCFHQTLLPVAQNSTTTSIPLLHDPFDRPVKDENSKRPRFPSQNVDLTFSSSSLDILRQDSDPQTIPAATPIVDIAASCSDSVSSGSVCVVEDDIATHTPANVPQQPTYVQGSSNALQIMVSNPPLVHATSRVVANFYREVMRSRAKPLMDASPASSFGAGNTPRSEGSFDYRKSPQHHNHQSANPSSVNTPHSQGSFDCSKSPRHHSHPNVEPSSVHLDPKDSPHHSETSVSVPSKASLGSAIKYHQMLPVSGGDKPSSNHGLSSPLVSQIYPAFSHSNQSSPGLGLNHNFSSLLPFDHQKSPHHHNHPSAEPSSVNTLRSQGSFDCRKSPHHHSHPNVEASSAHLDPKDSPHHSETSASVPSSKASLGSTNKHYQMLPTSGGDKLRPLVSRIYPAYSHSKQVSPGLGLNHHFSSPLPFDSPDPRAHKEISPMVYPLESVGNSSLSLQQHYSSPAASNSSSSNRGGEKIDARSDEKQYKISRRGDAETSPKQRFHRFARVNFQLDPLTKEERDETIKESQPTSETRLAPPANRKVLWSEPPQRQPPPDPEPMDCFEAAKLPIETQLAIDPDGPDRTCSIEETCSYEYNSMGTTEVMNGKGGDDNSITTLIESIKESAHRLADQESKNCRRSDPPTGVTEFISVAIPFAPEKIAAEKSLQVFVGSSFGPIGAEIAEHSEPQVKRTAIDADPSMRDSSSQRCRSPREPRGTRFVGRRMKRSVSSIKPKHRKTSGNEVENAENRTDHETSSKQSVSLGSATRTDATRSGADDLLGDTRQTADSHDTLNREQIPYYQSNAPRPLVQIANESGGSWNEKNERYPNVPSENAQERQIHRAPSDGEDTASRKEDWLQTGPTEKSHKTVEWSDAVGNNGREESDRQHRINHSSSSVSSLSCVAEQKQRSHPGTRSEKKQYYKSRGNPDFKSYDPTTHRDAKSVGSYSTWGTTDRDLLVAVAHHGADNMRRNDPPVHSTPQAGLVGRHLPDHNVITISSSDTSESTDSTAIEDIIARCQQKLEFSRYERGSRFESRELE